MTTRTAVLTATAVGTVIALGVLAHLDPQVKETGTVIGAFLLGMIALLGLGAILIAPLADLWTTDDHDDRDGLNEPLTAATTGRAPHTGGIR